MPYDHHAAYVETRSQPENNQSSVFRDITARGNRSRASKASGKGYGSTINKVKTPASAKMRAVKQRHRNQAQRNSAFFVNQAVTSATQLFGDMNFQEPGQPE